MSRNIESFSALTSLETFKPDIFKGTQQIPQDLCNFILALACVYNDYKNILMAFHYLDYLRPPFPIKETPEWGEFNGLKFHVIRLHMSLVHELLDLIKRNASVLNNSYFEKITSHLDDLGKDTWDALIEASSGNANTNIGKLFLLIRNKVSFHYDPKGFSQGYQNWFLKSGSKKKPYLSRSDNIKEERYYFAEASAQGYYEKLCADKCLDMPQILEIATSLGPALSQIVKGFIDSRCTEQ